MVATWATLGSTLYAALVSAGWLAVERAAQANRGRIAAEVAGLVGHPWAGEYEAGGGFGNSSQLLVAPKAGYLYERSGCLGVYDRDFGPVAAAGGRLHLRFTFPNGRGGRRLIGAQLVPVGWGPRRYLVPAGDLIDFCNGVNLGAESRARGGGGSHFLRRGDADKAAAGWPDVPAEYRDYLLAEPVEATIVAVGAVTTRPSICDWKFKDTAVTLGAGRGRGLKVGMELVVIDPDNVIERVTVTTVEGGRCQAVMTQIGEEAAGPKAGWRVSTRCPLYTGPK